MKTGIYDSPLGRIVLAADGEGLIGLWFEGQRHFGSTLEYALAPDDGRGDNVLSLTCHWLDEYFSGSVPHSTPPLRLVGTPFQREVWLRLLDIAPGTTMSYGALAKDLEADGRHSMVSPRAVGAAVGRNPVSIIVPCHRVVASDGSLRGYAGGLQRKRQLLDLECKGNLFPFPPSVPK